MIDLRERIARAIADKRRHYHDMSAALSQETWGHTGGFIAEWHFGLEQTLDAVMEAIAAHLATVSSSVPAVNEAACECEMGWQCDFCRQFARGYNGHRARSLRAAIEGLCDAANRRAKAWGADDHPVVFVSDLRATLAAPQHEDTALQTAAQRVAAWAEFDSRNRPDRTDDDPLGISYGDRFAVTRGDLVALSRAVEETK